MTKDYYMLELDDAVAALEAKDEQITEAIELLHHLYDTFCKPGDCNEITDYFDKWRC